jgi:small-conductance mechanosensitive channel
MVREIVSGQQLTRFDRCHFLTYGESSLSFETVYWILSSDFNTYADIQQAINLEIFRRFAAEGIEFAYPTRTLHVRGSGDGIGRAPAR